MKVRGRTKERIGIVVKDKMDKSIIVRIDRTAMHPKYKRAVRLSSKVMVHDPENKAREGETVKIRETRPLSKNKRWRLVEIIGRQQ